MMNYCRLARKRVKVVICVFKDKLGASFLIKSRKTTITSSIIRATSHNPSSPPSVERIQTVLSLGGHGTRATSCACIEAIMFRLHNTRDAYLALKSLLLLHNILLRGTFILKDQLSFYPSSGGRNFLNLSNFRDPDTREVSSWVRWYAGVVEQSLISSRVIGFFVADNSFRLSLLHKEESTASSLTNSDLFREVDALVGFVEQVSGSPDSFYLRKNDVVNEVVRVAAENYGLVQREIWVRVKEWEGRIEPGLCATEELVQLVGLLERLEQSRERLLMLFVNRKRNDAFWDLIAQIKAKAVTEKNGALWTRFG